MTVDLVWLTLNTGALTASIWLTLYATIRVIGWAYTAPVDIGEAP